MPFKSKAQQRFMFAAEDRGDLPEGTAERWAKHTKSIKKLPEKAKKDDKKEKKACIVEQSVALVSRMIEVSNCRGSIETALLKAAAAPRKPKPGPIVPEPLPGKPEGASNLLTSLAGPAVIGAALGGGAAMVTDPADEEVKNLQKQEQLAHYEEAIAELKSRIASRHGVVV